MAMFHWDIDRYTFRNIDRLPEDNIDRSEAGGNDTGLYSAPLVQAGLQFAFLQVLWFHESCEGVYGSGPRNSERENLEVALDPEVVLNPEVALDPEVVLNPEIALDPEVVLNPEVALDPEVVWEPRGSSGPGGRFEPGGFFWTRRPGVRKNPEYLVLQGPYSAFLGKTTPGTCSDFSFCRSEAGHYRVPMMYSTSAGSHLRLRGFILGNLEVSRNQCSGTGGSVDIAPGGESSSCCLEPIVSIDFIKNRTLSSEDGPLSMSTGCGRMSRFHWLPFVDPFSMSSGPYRAASLF
ncbi:hypothetical protein F2Q68_00005357 [Brassica cretica]|uniref:Uncharacterized protein n=1 Tax=Brassica cretica TaxID=69181 RepID=A0A8S9J725_BRACR|nr:hypothetical protein F2Q68_00005357 [Brassica cretica]